MKGKISNCLSCSSKLQCVSIGSVACCLVFVIKNYWTVLTKYWSMLSGVVQVKRDNDGKILFARLR